MAELFAQGNNEAPPLYTACHFCLPEVVEWLVKPDAPLTYAMLIQTTKRSKPARVCIALAQG